MPMALWPQLRGRPGSATTDYIGPAEARGLIYSMQYECSGQVAAHKTIFQQVPSQSESDYTL